MPTSIEFPYTSGMVLAASVFQVNADTPDATADTVLEYTNQRGIYVATFDPELPDDDYRLVYFSGDTSGPALGSERLYRNPETGNLEIRSEQLCGTGDGSVGNEQLNVYRSMDDAAPLRFSWHDQNAVVTGKVSINDGPFVPVAGAINYFRDEGGRHIFRLDYDDADRPDTPGHAVYEFTDGVELLSVHMQIVANNTSGGGGPGQYSINFRVVDDLNGDGVMGTVVSLQGTTVSAVTDTLGYVTLFASDGTYDVVITPPSGFQYTGAPIQVTVAGADLPLQTVTLTTVSVPPPPSPSLCNVIVKVIDVYGQPVPDATIKAKLSADVRRASNSLIANTHDTKLTDDNGIATLTLIRNTEFADCCEAEYTIYVESHCDTQEMKYVVPDADSTWLVIAPGSPYGPSAGTPCSPYDSYSSYP